MGLTSVMPQRELCILCYKNDGQVLYLVYNVALMRYVILKGSFREKGKVVLLGDFNARVGKAADDDDDVIGKFGEDTCNASGISSSPFCVK